MSQGTGAVSEMSDEAAPILGRRATRERNIGSSKHSDDSDSDVDMYRVSKTFLGNLIISRIYIQVSIYRIKHSKQQM